MSKFTNSFKTLEALLEIDFDTVPGFDNFLKMYFDMQTLENSEECFDPRKSSDILTDFKKFMSPKDYNLVLRDFKQ